MAFYRASDYLVGLVRELCKVPCETEWLEFKLNETRPERIGEYLSALANAAALHQRYAAHMLWGISNDRHEIVGTTFSPAAAKKGNELLEAWLARLLEPRVDFRFHELTVEGERVVLLEIDAAFQRPVAFKGVEYIRVASTSRRLSDFPEKEKALWRTWDRTQFEEGIAAAHVDDGFVLKELDYGTYFALVEVPVPNGHRLILEYLELDGLIKASPAGGWDITNLGALLLARDLSRFAGLDRKAVRVIQYQGMGRFRAHREIEFTEGYAVGIDRLVDYVLALLPANEVIEKVFRRSVSMFPPEAVRELITNMLIHQDLGVSGAGPMVEVFDGHIEFTNPGRPLVDTRRILDAPPRSRNNMLASRMRRFGICEERGSGIDRVVFEMEFFQLPAPRFEVPEEFTRVVLLGSKDPTEMDPGERVWTIYMHACLRYVLGQRVNNQSVRERFGLAGSESSKASRWLREALDEGVIVLRNPKVGTRNRAYLPYWAGQVNGNGPFA